MSDYPGALDSFTTKTDSVNDVMAVDVNDLQASVVALETELGVNPAGTATDVVTRLSKALSGTGLLQFASGTTLTIASGAVAVTQNWHRIDTEGGASSDDLNTITGGAEGMILVLRNVVAGRTVTIRHATGNVRCSGNANIAMANPYDLVVLVYDNTLGYWIAGITNNLITSTINPINHYIAVYNYYLGANPVGYQLGVARSQDGRHWTIASEPGIPLGASTTWDDFTLQFPNLLSVNGVLYCYYAGKPAEAWTDFKIGLARSFDGGYTWTKYASNPILSPAGWENSALVTPIVLYDYEESNAAKRFKMWYGGSSFGQGIGYAYSADGLSWTKYASNPVVNLGTAGAWDDTYIVPTSIIRRGETYILFYAGRKTKWQGGYVTFSDPEGTYTKNAGNPILVSDGITSQTTENLAAGGTIVTVADATIFPIGCPVWVLISTTRYLTRVTAQLTTTTLQLADGAPVAIGSGGTVRSVAYNSVEAHHVHYNNGYVFAITAHQPDGDGETGVHEVSLLGWARDGLEKIYIDYQGGLQIPITPTEGQGTAVSRENWTYIDLYETERGMIPNFGIEQTALTTQLTTITASAPGTPDYAIQDLVQSTGFGFVTADEGQSVLKVILNLQTRVAELETKLQANDLIA